MEQKFHLTANDGEIAELYSLCFIGGIYHIFLLTQSTSENKSWLHYETADFLTYRLSSGKADIIDYKKEKHHFFANTEGKSVMMEIVKPPDRKRKSFLSLPRKAVISDGNLLQYPLELLSELREYKRNVTLLEGETEDTFGTIFEARLIFSQEAFRLMLRENVCIGYADGIFSVEYNTLFQSFDALNISEVHIFSDTFSVEIFAGGNVLSIPVGYDEKGTVTILEGQCRAEIYKLKSIKIE